MYALTRRGFVLTGAAAVLTGCSSTTPPPPVQAEGQPTLSVEDQERIGREKEIRRKHLIMLEQFRVIHLEKRTTPPTVDITKEIRELGSQLRPAFRLHPRFGEEPAADATKLGGTFLWPKSEPWPKCPESHIPFVGVLQLNQLHTTNRIPFMPGSTMMQILWKPRDPVNGELTVKVVWRNRLALANEKLLDQQQFDTSYPSMVPVPCLTFPEVIRELPDWDTLAAIDPSLRAKLEGWKPPVESGLDAKTFYNRNLSAARGVVVGGWPRNANAVPQCKVCRDPMNYFLTIDTSEWTPMEASRWRPTEDTDDAIGRRAASGLSFAGGIAVELSYCRKCNDMPVRAMVVK